MNCFITCSIFATVAAIALCWKQTWWNQLLCETIGVQSCAKERNITSSACFGANQPHAPRVQTLPSPPLAHPCSSIQGFTSTIYSALIFFRRQPVTPAMLLTWFLWFGLLSSTFSPGDFILLVVSSFLRRNEMLPSLPSPAPLSFCSIICTAKPKTALVEKWAESPNVAESRTWSSKPRAIVSPARPCRGFCHCRGHREIPDGAQSCCLLLFDLYQFQITQYSSRMLVCSLASGLFKRGYLGGN